MSADDSPRSAPDAFDRVAGDYDAWVRQALPTYGEVFRVACEVLPHDASAAIRVADLGAGTGLFSARLAERHPRASFELFDASPEMLARARRRLAAQGERFTFREQRLEAFRDVGRYDLVVSSLAIHHLEHPEKRALFGRVREALRPGGAFVNVDQVRGEPPFDELYWSTWLARVRAAGAPETRIRSSVERRRAFDRDAGLAEQLGWLAEAGFAADCIYKHYFVAVFLALRP